MKPLKLFWSRGRERNAGDWFSPLICECLSGRAVKYADPRTCDLVAVGSVLARLNKSHSLHRFGFVRQVDVWGTGSLRSHDRLWRSHRLHAVRGRLTLALCGLVDTVPKLGDPGLLANLLLDAPVAKRHGIGVVPHVVDRGHPELHAFLAATRHVRLLDITAPVGRLLVEMAQCESILSSSLHGLVFADALGIPNRWIALSGKLIGDRHKFDDYYSAFGLEQRPLPLADLVGEAALGAGAVEQGVFEAYRRPGIEGLKQSLLASFPYR